MIGGSKCELPLFTEPLGGDTTFPTGAAETTSEMLFTGASLSGELGKGTLVGESGGPATGVDTGAGGVGSNGDISADGTTFLSFAADADSKAALRRASEIAVPGPGPRLLFASGVSSPLDASFVVTGTDAYDVSAEPVVRTGAIAGVVV